MKKKRTGFNRAVFSKFLISKKRKNEKIERYAKRTGFDSAKKKRVKTTAFFAKKVRHKVPPLQRHFLAKKERGFSQAKIEIHTFLNPDLKNFCDFCKNEEKLTKKVRVFTLSDF